MNDLDPKRFDIGAHRIQLRGPGEVSLTLSGPMSVEEAEELTTLVRELAQSHGPLYLLIDTTFFVSSGQRVRKVFAEGDMFTNQLLAVGVWGASFPLRITINMVIKASSRLLPGRFQFPFEFFATEQQACAWIVSLRDRYLQEQTTQQRLQATGT